MTTHWLPISPSYSRMGVNARIFGKTVTGVLPIRKSTP